MKLINKYKDIPQCKNEREFYCELTDELDKLAKLDLNKKELYQWRHYIVADERCIKMKCLAIRIPGGTVGGVWFDDDRVITNIIVDTDYVVKTYSKDVNEQIKKFIGYRIEFESAA